MEVKHVKKSVFVTLLFFVCVVDFYPAQGAIHQTLTHCCDLGKNFANSDVSCANIKPPFDNVDKKDERSCQSTSMICCNAQAKENECRFGINDAQNGSCNSASGSERQECCEACNLGKITASSGSCDNTFSLGASYDKHFKSCCQKALPKTTTDPSTVKTDEVQSLGNLCEIEDLCAQICIPSGDSYRCECNPGYTLMADGNSCKEVSKPSSKKNSRCDVNNPCEHNCVDTGVAIYCTCYDGYELDKDKRSCIDIDECTLDHDCHANETCVNRDGYYECVEVGDDEDYSLVECQVGYRYSWENKMCEDINECLLPLTCLPSQVCKNTDGSYECSGNELVCPPGYFFKSSTQDCADIDECVTGDNECNRESQVCLNNKGSYTCVDKASKKTCPPGFMMNPMLEICVDIDECAQEIPLCAADELCVNEEGGHTCVPHGKDPKPILTTTTTTPRPKPAATTTKTTTTAKTTTTSTKPTTTSKPTTTTTTIRTTTTTTTIRSTPIFTPPPVLRTTRKPYSQGFRPAPPVTCNRGYKYSPTSKQCEDVDECATGYHNCDNYQQCYNTLGSYICNCKVGFAKDPITGACQDINECQLGHNDCGDGQRCDNTVGSFLCSRVASCGTGYTLNYETGACEDDDECALGTHSCDRAGKNYICRNTQGSYRCIPPPQPVKPVFHKPEVIPVIRPYVKPVTTTTVSPAPPPPPPPYRPIRYPIYHTSNYPNYTAANVPIYTVVSSQSKKCLPGYYMDSSGACKDVDECQSNPCPRSQNCINFNGRYECKPKLICTAGFELDSSGEACVDINECIRGNHSCDSTEICKNHVGFYRCECPIGHIKKNNRCEDIDECQFSWGRVCSYNSLCINTIGSYECRCKDGYEKIDNRCVDIDECKEPGKCDSKCQNTMGGYKCYCERGYTLNSDNRTCSDVDECNMFSHQIKCVGTCINSPGSYKCGCPEGYRLGADGHTCQDIDECNTPLAKTCKGPDNICFNTRGGFECASIACPKNYIRDRNLVSRCKLDTEYCRFSGKCSTQDPDQISYHFFSVVSNYAIVDEPTKIFKMHGPQSLQSRVAFKLDLKNIRYANSIIPATQDYFQLIQEQNSVTLSILKSIEGPQQIELTIQMQIFNHNILTNTIISKIILYISQYSF